MVTAMQVAPKGQMNAGEQSLLAENSGRKEGESVKRWKKALCAALAAGLLIGGVSTNTPAVKAADKVLTLKQAQGLAVSRDAEYQKLLNKMELQEVKYTAAVKSIKMKKKNMSTFRWSPLLSFKFPEKPSLMDEYEWKYEPLAITTEIQQLEHQLSDAGLAAREEVSLAYVDAYISQEKIGFYEESLTNAQMALERNRARLAAGEANQSDIDKLEKAVENLTTTLSLQMRTFESSKSKISRLIQLDISNGYSFENPFVEVDIPRSVLTKLVEFTLNNDQSYYDMKLDTQLSLTALNTAYSLMESKYGEKMGYVSGYVNQIRGGAGVDGSAFKKAYDQFLTAIDAPWEGSYRILFIRFPKEWLKGSKDGARYVEDDPYILYTGALEYMDMKQELDTVRQELTDSVTDGFETLITAKNAYEGAKKNAEELGEDVEKSTYLNQLGELTFAELSDLQTDYEEAQMEALELLAEYSKLLYSYDRLTCGGITGYMTGEAMDTGAAFGGVSYLEEEKAQGATYYIQSKVEDNVFILGIHIPEDFSLEVTHFELYVDGTRIGEKTAADRYLQHLALDIGSYETAKLYLYNEDQLLDICEIDAEVYQGDLDITSGYRVIDTASVRAVASYKYTSDDTLGTASIQFTKNEEEPIFYYQVVNQADTAVLSEELTLIGEAFTYLKLLTADFGQLKVRFYDSSKNLLYTGTFQTLTAEIVVPKEE